MKIKLLSFLTCFIGMVNAQNSFCDKLAESGVFLLPSEENIINISQSQGYQFLYEELQKYKSMSYERASEESANANIPINGIMVGFGLTKGSSDWKTFVSYLNDEKLFYEQYKKSDYNSIKKVYYDYSEAMKKCIDEQKGFQLYLIPSDSTNFFLHYHYAKPDAKNSPDSINVELIFNVKFVNGENKIIEKTKSFNVSSGQLMAAKYIGYPWNTIEGVDITYETKDIENHVGNNPLSWKKADFRAPQTSIFDTEKSPAFYTFYLKSKDDENAQTSNDIYIKLIGKNNVQSDWYIITPKDGTNKVNYKTISKEIKISEGFVKLEKIVLRINPKDNKINDYKIDYIAIKPSTTTSYKKYYFTKNLGDGKAGGESKSYWYLVYDVKTNEDIKRKSESDNLSKY